MTLYDHADIAGRLNSIDDLRSLAIHYAASVVQDVARSEKFQSLLEEGGSFARDLVRQKTTGMNGFRSGLRITAALDEIDGLYLGSITVNFSGWTIRGSGNSGNTG